MRRLFPLLIAFLASCGLLTDLDGWSSGSTAPGAGTSDAGEEVATNDDGGRRADPDPSVLPDASADARVTGPGSCGDQGCACEPRATCTRTCRGGPCAMRCSDSSTCIFTCEEGGCDVTCSGSATCRVACPKGNCTVAVAVADLALTCPGNGCDVSCINSSDCFVRGCTARCGVVCKNSSKCSSDCTAASCSVSND